jgi:CheY-like chemotaxis protein
MPDTARSKIIALTGYGQPDDYRRSMAAGFDQHLVKPLDPGAVVAILRE